MGGVLGRLVSRPRCRRRPLRYPPYTAPVTSRVDRVERIGLFGGTFDPPHVGHLAAAVNARHDLDLDVVLLVVANIPWQKVGERTISPAHARLELVRLAVGDVEGLEVCDREIRRGGRSYTADTVDDLLAEAPSSRELFVIVGSDAAEGLPTWERVDEVRERAVIVVVDRPGGAWSPPPGWAPVPTCSPTACGSRACARAHPTVGTSACRPASSRARCPTPGSTQRSSPRGSRPTSRYAAPPRRTTARAPG